MAEIRQDKNGNLYLVEPGNALRPITEEQAYTIQENPNIVESFFRSAGESAKEAALGLHMVAADILPGLSYGEEAEQELARTRQAQEAQGIVNPISSFLGTAAPAVAAGVLTSGSIPAIAATEAGLGAAYTPENPLLGAGLGATIGAAVPGAQRAVSSVGRKMLPGGRPVRQITDAVEPDEVLPPAAVEPWEPKQLVDESMGVNVEHPSATGRRRPAILREGTDGPGGGGPGSIDEPPRPGPGSDRYHPGMLDADEMDSIGMQTTAGDRAQLFSRNAAEDLRGQRRRYVEEAASSDPIGGYIYQGVRANNKRVFNAEVNRVLGRDNTALNPAALGEVFDNLGGQYQEFAGAVGPIGIDNIQRQFDNVMEFVTGDHKELMNRLVQETKDKAALNNGVLTGEQALTMTQKFGRAINSSINNPEKLSDIGQLKEIIDDAIENTLRGTPYYRKIKSLNYKYRLAKTLTRSGVVDSNGLINPRSFQNGWLNRRAIEGFQKAQTDYISRLANTMVFLDTKALPTSGTAERLMAAGAGNVTRIGAAGVGGAGILGGLSSL